MKPLSIAIVGSGTSGLAAAAFLMRDGHDVTLFERFSEPRPLGAGIMLQPTGLACLACLGLDKKALGYGAKIYNLHGQSAKGAVVFDIRYNDLNPHFFGLGIHRGALFHLLYDEVKRQKIKIVTSCQITAARLDKDKRILIDKQGEVRGAFDLVIDASGAKSALRTQAGQLKYNKPYPYGAVWGVCEDPAQSFGQDYLRQRYDGAGVMIGALAIGKNPATDKDSLAFFWSLRTDTYNNWRTEGLAPWKNRVQGYWPELWPFLAQFETVDDLTFAQYSDAIMKSWYDERMVFIGDAAHSTSPQLGQGANLGLIDALTLAGCLKGGDALPDALAQYNQMRRRHTHFYQMASRWLTPFFQSDIKAAAWLRDKTFGMLCKTPYIKTQMLRTLAGLKTGVFTHLDPGIWHEGYALRKSQPR